MKPVPASVYSVPDRPLTPDEEDEVYRRNDSKIGRSRPARTPRSRKEAKGGKDTGESPERLTNDYNAKETP